MKTLYKLLWAAWAGIAINAITCGIGFGQAEIDITKVVANRHTVKFNDGSSVTAYVEAVLKNKTQCCGNDKLYLEVKLDDKGYVVSARALMGNNNCIKKSVSDILKYIRWSSDPAVDTKASFYLPMEVKAPECKGIADENKYAAVPPPEGWAKSDAPLPIATNPTPAGNNTTKPPVATTNPPNPAGNTKPNPENPAGGPSNKPNPATGTNANPATNPSTGPATNPPGGNSLPAKTISGEMVNVLKADTFQNCGLMPTVLPNSFYKSAGDLHPDASHKKSILNTQGPMYQVTDYLNGKSATAVMIKSKLRRKGVCGLAHVLAELTIKPEGNVNGFRIFRANSESIVKHMPGIICDMKFKPVTRQTYFILEFKTDIDCPGAEKVALEQVEAYFVAPEKGMREKKNKDEIKREKDE